MTTWIFVIAITAIACATLYYAAARRTVNAGTSPVDATNAHFRLQLAEIDTDSAAGRLNEAEAIAARGELAREVIRLKGEGGTEVAGEGGRWSALFPIAAIALLSLGTYWMLGRPDLPAEPLAARSAATETSIDLGAAIETIEARLTQAPDDLRGWKVIAPAYMQLGRYADAVRAFARVNELAPPTADSEADLAEAMMARDGGAVKPETMALLKSAASRDAKHVRSRFYIAGEETRAGQYEAAVTDWTALLALGTGEEPWAVTARDGLKFAEAALHPAASDAADQPQIDAMVDGLDARLKTQGGTVAEWTQLVRSRLVQGRVEEAQAAYDAARKAYPDALMRVDLDVLAADNGLVAKPKP
jgi:cytochrome c-type biogenesis protein CcmH